LVALAGQTYRIRLGSLGRQNGPGGDLLVVFSGTAATATPTPSPTAVCTPRPSVAVAVTPLGDGRLQVVLTPKGSGRARLLALKLGVVTNARLDVGAQTSLGSNAVLSFPPETLSTTFVMNRVGDGTTATAQMVVVDACGRWSTFVGGCPDAF
jgi:hypothetical protein